MTYETILQQTTYPDSIDPDVKVWLQRPAEGKEAADSEPK